MGFARRVVAGTGWLSLAGLLAKAVGLLTVPILTAAFGPAPFGEFAVFTTIVGLGSAIALAGVDMAYSRFYLQHDDVSREAVERFCWRFTLAASVLVALGIGAAWRWTGAGWPPDKRAMALVASVAVLVLTVAVAMATTRRRLAGRYRLIAGSTLAAALAGAAATLGAARAHVEGLTALVLGSVIGPLVALAMLRSPPLKALGTPSGLPTVVKRRILAMGLAGSITAPLYWVIMSSDRLLLARHADAATVGIYSMSASLALIGVIVNSSVTLTWFPEAARLHKAQPDGWSAALARHWERMVVALALVWLAIAGVGGEALRLLTAPAFHAGTDHLPYLAGGIFFHGFAAMSTTAFFLHSRMGVVAWCWLAGAALNVALNVVFIPIHLAAAAALAQAAGFALIALLVTLRAQRLMPLPVRWGRLLTTLSLVLAAGVSIHPPWAPQPLPSLLLKLAPLLGAMALVAAITTSGPLVALARSLRAAVAPAVPRKPNVER